MKLINPIRIKKENFHAAIFLAPNFCGFLLFTTFPVIFALILSFFHWDMFTSPQFVGLDNFARLLSDEKLWYYLYNTLFLLLGLPLNIAGSLFLASILSRKMKGVVFFRTIFYLPTITSGVALFMLWKWIYNPQHGLLNKILLQFCRIFDSEIMIDAMPMWLLDPNLAKPAIILMGFWVAVGGTNMILYLAALSNVPVSLYEASEIDGAGKWQQFKHITWPMISPTTFFIIITGTIGGLQGGFEMAYIMTQGGPAGATTTLGYYIFSTAFENLDMGYAAAQSWLLFIIIFLITLLNWKFGNKRVFS